MPETTTKFKVDISELKSNIKEANRLIRLANSEFKAASSGMDDWAHSADGLSAKVTQLDKVLDAEKTKLKSLKEQYRQVAEEQGENSKGAQELAIKINNQLSAVNKVERELRKYNETLEELANESDDAEKEAKGLSAELEDVGDAAKDADGKLSGLAQSLKSGIANGFKAIGAAAVAAGAAFLASGEASQEYVEDMGKLEAGFTSAGHSADTARASYEGMVGILGETDQSVEAVNHLARLTKNEEELAKWTDIAAGVYGTFGDSLPIEGLTEAANETAKVGKVTGPLADALNWAGINEEKFNEQLAACNTEQERATLITETLAKQYEAAAETYKDVNADLIEARQAADDFKEAMAEMGKIAMPINTAIKQSFADLIKSLVPGMKQIVDGVKGILTGKEGAFGELGEGVTNIVTTLANSIKSKLPQLLTVGKDILTFLVNGVMVGIPQLIETGSKMLTNIGNGIAQNLPSLISKALDMVQGFADMLAQNAPTLISAGVGMLVNLVKGIMDSLPTMISKIPTIISTFANIINDNVPTILKAGINILVTLVKGIIGAIPTLVKNIPKIITAFVDVWEAFNWVNLGKKAITFLTNGIKSMVGTAKTSGKSILESIANVIRELPTRLATFGRNAVNDLGGTLKAGVSTLKSKAGEIVTGIATKIGELPGKMLTMGKDLVKGLWNGISDMTGWIIGKIESFGDSVLDGIADFFGIHSPSRVMRDFVGKNLVLGIGEGIDKNKNAVTAPIEKIGQLISSLFGSEVSMEGFDMSFGTGAATAFVQTIKEPIELLKTELPQIIMLAITNMATTIYTEARKKTNVNKFKELAKQILRAVDDLPDDFEDIGEDMIDGMIEGLENREGALYSKINSIVKKAIRKAKEAADINSPSRIMRDLIGKNLIEGIVVGINDKAASLNKTIGQSVTGAIGAARDSLSGINQELAMNGVGGNVYHVTFHQYNTSPKALNRMDIYRDTKKLLTTLKGM